MAEPQAGRQPEAESMADEAWSPTPAAEPAVAEAPVRQEKPSQAKRDESGETVPEAAPEPAPAQSGSSRRKPKDQEKERPKRRGWWQWR